MCTFPDLRPRPLHLPVLPTLLGDTAWARPASRLELGDQEGRGAWQTVACGGRGAGMRGKEAVSESLAADGVSASSRDQAGERRARPGPGAGGVRQAACRARDRGAGGCILGGFLESAKSQFCTQALGPGDTGGVSSRGDRAGAAGGSGHPAHEGAGGDALGFRVSRRCRRRPGGCSGTAQCPQKLLEGGPEAHPGAWAAVREEGALGHCRGRGQGVLSVNRARCRRVCASCYILGKKKPDIRT